MLGLAWLNIIIPIANEMIAGYIIELGPLLSNSLPVNGRDIRTATAYTTKKKLQLLLNLRRNFNSI